MMTRGGAGEVLSETGERRGVRGAPAVDDPTGSLAFGVAALLVGVAGAADDPLDDFVGCLVFPSEPTPFVLNWIGSAGQRVQYHELKRLQGKRESAKTLVFKAKAFTSQRCLVVFAGGRKHRGRAHPIPSSSTV